MILEFDLKSVRLLFCDAILNKVLQFIKNKARIVIFMLFKGMDIFCLVESKLYKIILLIIKIKWYGSYE